MLSIFRNLRKKNVSQYLLYSVGEILLVMIGILLALQVNNWNEYKKERKLERSTLFELKESVDATILSFESDLSSSFKKLEFTSELIDHLENNMSMPDSFPQKHNFPVQHTTITVNRSGYDLLTNRGIDIIRNEDLRKAIVRFFAFDVPDILSKAEYWHDRTHRYQEYYYTYVDTAPLNNDFLSSFERLKNDQTMIRWLKRSVSLRELQASNISWLLKNAKELQRLLGEELE